MFSLVALVRADVSKERTASIIRVTRLGEVGTTLAVTSNRLCGTIENRWGATGYIMNAVFWDVQPCGSFKS
jgi:hypothetical protein